MLRQGRTREERDRGGHAEGYSQEFCNELHLFFLSDLSLEAARVQSDGERRANSWKGIARMRMGYQDYAADRWN